MKKLVALLVVFVCVVCHAQNRGVQILTSGTNTGLRGMSIPQEKVIWVSGTNGTVGKSVDGGASWRWMIVPGFEKKDFRDIEAFDSSTAIVMAVDNPAYLLKTSDGGATWRKVFERSQNGMFLDAMDFKNEKQGICVGDPLVIDKSGRRIYYIIRTEDGGETWAETQMYKMPPAQPDEAIFSASGTNIWFLDHPDFEYAFVTGGKISNLYMVGREGKQSKVVQIPINQGIASTGTFSVATDRMKKFYCVGGDYKETFNAYDNFYYTTDGGDKWGSPAFAPPNGYRSCISIIDGKKLVCCGPTGVDFCKDGGKDWMNITKEGFNVCGVSKESKTVFLAGEKGKIGRLVY